MDWKSERSSLCEVYRSLVAKRELRNIAELWVIIPVLNYGHEPCASAERVLVQSNTISEMGFLRRLHGMTLRDKVDIYEICNPLTIESPSPNRPISATMLQQYDQNSPGKIGDATLAGYTDFKGAQKATKDQVA